MGCAVYFLCCGVAETQQNNYGHTLHRSANLISIPRLAHFTCFVCFGFKCGKYFLIKYLVIKSWLHVWFVWLISRFSDWDWHSLLTVHMDVIMPLLGYCCTEAQMETTNLYLQRPLQRERILTEWQTCFFFIWLNPPTAGSQQPPGALSPLLILFVTLFTHISAEVYYRRAVYTNLLYYSHCLCTILHCIFVFMLRNK